MFRPIDDIIREIENISVKKESVVSRIKSSMDLYYATHDSLQAAQDIYEKRMESVFYVEEAIPARREIVEQLSEQGLIGKLDYPTDTDVFESYFEDPKAIALEKIAKLTNRRSKEGKDSLVDAVISKAHYGAQIEPQASFDVLDYFVAESSNDETIRFVRDIGAPLYDAGFVGKAHYTRTGRALEVYQHALLSGQADEAFNDAFIQFASGVEPEEPVGGGMGAGLAWDAEKHRFKAFVDSVKNGGGKAVADFMQYMPAELQGIKETYQGMHQEVSKYFQIDEAIKATIPDQIRNVTHLADMCMRAGRQYVMDA